MNNDFKGFPENKDFVHNISFFTQNASQEDVQYVPYNKKSQAQSDSHSATQQVTQQTSQNNNNGLLTQNQVNAYVEQCKPFIMGNPVKITQPSYLITEQQMIYLLSLAQGKPLSNLMPDEKQKASKSNGEHERCIVIGDTTQLRPTNVVDTFCNATLGTVGRIGHAFTGIVDSTIDVLTLGYSMKK